MYSSPPPYRPFREAKPTLLVAWWITVFCTCLTLLRLAGRYVRVERLFLEDKIIALSLIPMYIRMACAHFVLLYGTNNSELPGLTDAELHNRATASRLVLASRVFYAATLWTIKLATLEFMSRLAGASMKKKYLLTIRIIRYILAASFIAVVVSDLAECRPIYRYWQVTPDPGPQCRQGFAQLLTAGACSVAIDAVLIVFPIPIVISTRIATHRKVLLVLLFCLGFGTIGITLYRLPATIQAHGDQVFRSMWVSIELLAATAVANLVALGSFLRDSGAKKNKFQQNYPSTDNPASVVVQRTAHQWPDDVSDDSWEERAASKGGIDTAPSRTESHDSLIEAGLRVDTDEGVTEMRIPTRPSPSVVRQRE